MYNRLCKDVCVVSRRSSRPLKNHFYKSRECGKAQRLLKTQSDKIEIVVLDFDFASQFSQSTTPAKTWT